MCVFMFVYRYIYGIDTDAVDIDTHTDKTTDVSQRVFVLSEDVGAVARIVMPCIKSLHSFDSLVPQFVQGVVRCCLGHARRAMYQLSRAPENKTIYQDICMHVYIYICICIYLCHPHTYMYMHTCIQVHTDVYIHIYMYTYTHEYGFCRGT